MLVKSEHKEILERSIIAGYTPMPDEDTINALKNCAAIIYKRLKSNRQSIGQQILHDLLSAYIGMIAEVYQKESAIPTKNQPAIITSQFKSLLSENYKSLKRPSQYAEKLNITSAYLNECVKKITGLTASDWIQNEITLQAKRLLFYTNLNVKEIALQLGYEDWAYFTRLFAKTTNLSPTRFRKEYLKYRD